MLRNYKNAGKFVKICTNKYTFIQYNQTHCGKTVGYLNDTAI